MSFKLFYHPDVRKIDIPKLDRRMQERIKRAIKSRLATAPHQYGEPLKRTLKGYWKLRVGDYRVVFKLSGTEVWIFGIIHRKEIYDQVKHRL